MENEITWVEFPIGEAWSPSLSEQIFQLLNFINAVLILLLPFWFIFAIVFILWRYWKKKPIKKFFWISVGITLAALFFILAVNIFGVLLGY